MGPHLDLLLLNKSAEEAVGLPLWTLVGARDAQRQFFQDGVELRGGSDVDGLVHVIRGRVVAFAVPGFEDFFLGRSGGVTELEGQRRNPFFDEAVLIAADKAVVLVGFRQSRRPMRRKAGESERAQGRSAGAM